MLENQSLYQNVYIALSMHGNAAKSAVHKKTIGTKAEQMIKCHMHTHMHTHMHMHTHLDAHTLFHLYIYTHAYTVHNGHEK